MSKSQILRKKIQKKKIQRKTKPIKPIKAWCVVDEDGKLVPSTTSLIKAWCESACYETDKVVRVEIRTI